MFLQAPLGIVGPFIRGKIRRELYYLYEHVLSKTRTARIHVNVARSNGN